MSMTSKKGPTIDWNWERHLANLSIRDVVKQFGLGRKVEEVLVILGWRTTTDLAKLASPIQTLRRIDLLRRYIEVVNNTVTNEELRESDDLYEVIAGAEIQSLVEKYGLGKKVAEVLIKAGCKKGADVLRVDGKLLGVEGCGERTFQKIYLLQRYVKVKHAKEEESKTDSE